MAWNPAIDLTGDPAVLRVGATDVASRCGCGRHLAFKARPKVNPATWRRSFSDDLPIVLRDVIDLVSEAHHAEGVETYAGLRAWLAARLDARGTRRLLRPYVETAVENVLEAHDAIEADLGPLSLLDAWPGIGPAGRRLTAWAPLYATDDGTREIRRIRVGSAHDDPTEADQLWAATAAHVAANFAGGTAPRRVRVVEIGAADGSIAVVFDGTAADADALYAGGARARAAAFLDEDHVVPCHECGTCKAAGACSALVRVDGMLGQSEPGIASRSVAPTALEKYARCPAQWLLDAELHLPKDRAGGEPVTRGNAVHRWLEAAHTRGVACRAEDLPDPAAGAGTGLADGLLTEGDYRLARPYLLGHVEVCPLSANGASVVAVEQAVHGWDEQAQVIPVTKPDLVYRVEDHLIIRETKSMQAPPAGKDDAYNRHLQIPFMLVLLADGLQARHGAASGAVELEVLGPDGPVVWAWGTDDDVAMAVARADVRRATDEWHFDTVWETRIGPHCSWCPVRAWCPDRDAWQERQHSGESAPSPGADWYEEDEAVPAPF